MGWFVSLFISLIISISVVHAEAYPLEKLIVGSYQDKALAEENLLKLKVSLFENNTTRLLTQKYQFDVKLEPFFDYYTLVISPLDSLEERNALLILLHPIFPDIFYVHEKKRINRKPRVSKEAMVKKHTPFREPIKQKEETWVNEMGLQWLALWILAVIGLLLSLRNRGKLRYLHRRQKEIKSDQIKIEKEMKALGD